MAEDRNLVQSVFKALEIMEALCRSRHCGVRELSEKLGLNRSTVNRLIGTLERAGYVEQEQQRGKYRASLRLFELGNQVIRRLDIRERAYPILQKLSEETKETVNLSVLDGNNVLFIQQVDSPLMLKSSAQVGSRAPVYCTACGKVILAFLPEDKKKKILPAEIYHYTPKTVRNTVELEAELAQIRADGYAVDDEGWCSNTKALAAPVWNYDHKIIAALTIVGPTVRMTPQCIKKMAPILVKEAKELSTKMGYRDLFANSPQNVLKRFKKPGTSNEVQSGEIGY